MLAPLDPRCQVVQFDSMLSESDFERLAELLRSRPDMTLRAYSSYDGCITDLEFLRLFGNASTVTRPDCNSWQRANQ